MIIKNEETGELYQFSHRVINEKYFESDSFFPKCPHSPDDDSFVLSDKAFESWKCTFEETLKRIEEILSDGQKIDPKFTEEELLICLTSADFKRTGFRGLDSKLKWILMNNKIKIASEMIADKYKLSIVDVTNSEYLWGKKNEVRERYLSEFLYSIDDIFSKIEERIEDVKDEKAFMLGISNFHNFLINNASKIDITYNKLLHIINIVRNPVVENRIVFRKLAVGRYVKAEEQVILKDKIFKKVNIRYRCAVEECLKEEAFFQLTRAVRQNSIAKGSTVNKVTLYYSCPVCHTINEADIEITGYHNILGFFNYKSEGEDIRLKECKKCKLSPLYPNI